MEILTEEFFAFSPGIEKVLKLFPRVVSNYIFEIALPRSEPEVDFSACVLSNEIGSVVKYWQDEGYSDIFLKDVHWRKLLQFCKLWDGNDHVLEKIIANVWFEFDDCQMKQDLPGACFFFSPTRLHKRIFPGLGKDSEAIQWLFDPVLHILAGHFLTERLKNRSQACIDALPRNGGIFQIGIMLPRNLERLRVCTTMPFNEYPEYLDRIGWSDSLKELEKILNHLQNSVDTVFVDIDVREAGIVPAVGIECCFQNTGHHIEKIREFFRYLTDRKLCISENSERILSWIDHYQDQDSAGTERQIKRTLSHFKFTLEKGDLSNAKAYLSISA